MNNFVSVIIAAAGDSTRMGGKYSKQFIPLLGKPAIVYTLLAFENSSVIDEIIIVCRQQDIDQMQKIAANNGISKLKACVVGGAARTESVKNGIAQISEQCTHIAIHDGARPLVTEAEINKTVLAAFDCGACSIGVPVTDTIKRISAQNVILDTPDRKTLFAVQTPQVFEKELYIRAHENADNIGSEITDDCLLVEMLGKPVSVITGEYTNIKLTTPADILYAEAILGLREG